MIELFIWVSESFHSVVTGRLFFSGGIARYQFLNQDSFISMLVHCLSLVGRVGSRVSEDILLLLNLTPHDRLLSSSAPCHYLETRFFGTH